MTRLSVNINKIATLRNARGGNTPDLVATALAIESMGAQGITVHPRPDERHIRYQDVFDLKQVVSQEFNVEGNPTTKFLDLVLKVKPTQVTLVPDAEDAITSNAGWDTLKNREFLKEVIQTLKQAGIRTSIFIDPVVAQIEGAVHTGTDRVELYTEAYAKTFQDNPQEAVKAYSQCALITHKIGLGVNAGHDLSLENIAFFKTNVPHLLEVSIGHALVCESLFQGLNNVISQYLIALK